MSELWCAVQPRAPYIVAAVRAPVTASSPMNVSSGSCSSARLADLRRPVVHLGVDVDGVVRAPRRPHLVVPDALQVGRLRAGPARRDQQVAPVLEQQLDEAGIRCRRALAIRRSVGRRPRPARPAAPATGDRTARGGRRRAPRGARPRPSRARHAICRTTIGPGSRPSRAGSLSKPLNAVAVARNSVTASAPSTRRPVALARDRAAVGDRRRRPARSACPAACGGPAAASAFRPRAHWPAGTPPSRP